MWWLWIVVAAVVIGIALWAFWPRAGSIDNGVIQRQQRNDADRAQRAKPRARRIDNPS